MACTHASAIWFRDLERCEYLRLNCDVLVTIGRLGKDSTFERVHSPSIAQEWPPPARSRRSANGIALVCLRSFDIAKKGA